jgi:predicted N-acetyltransferase YhbS
MIRKVEQNDIPAIKALMQSEPGFWQDVWRPDVLERGLASSGDLSFVWEEDGQVIGFVCAHDFGFRSYLSELIVKRSARNRDIGTKLVERIHQELSERGCAVLISDVWKDAEDFYKALGWSEPDAKLLRKRLEVKLC